MAEQPPLLAQSELGPVGELARLADVVQERRRDQQVRVEPRMQRAELQRQRADRDGVLEQAAEVGVVAGPRAGRPPELRATGSAEAGPARRPPAAPGRAPRASGARGSPPAPRPSDRPRAGTPRVELAPLSRRTSLELRLQLAPKALRPAPDLTASPRRTPRRDPVRLPEDPRGDRAAAVAKLQRQVGGAVSGGEPVLAHARDTAPRSAAPGGAPPPPGAALSLAVGVVCVAASTRSMVTRGADGAGTLGSLGGSDALGRGPPRAALAGAGRGVRADGTTQPARPRPRWRRSRCRSTPR